MAFKLGLVGLCTSHPQNWVPIIRKLTEEKFIDIEIVAAWDSGETRPAGFAKDFCKQFDIPVAVDRLAEMVDQVDGVIMHTTNWDKHIEQARSFVEAGKSVLIDKPLVGNLRDANQLLDWAKQKKRIMGGSSLRFTKEVKAFLSQPVEERGEVYHVHAGCGVDEFNYGIHAYSLISSVLGPGIKSVQYLGSNIQKYLKINCMDGKIGILVIGKTSGWIPFFLNVITTKKVEQIICDAGSLYRGLLEANLPYLTGKTDQPPLPMDILLEPELAAIAARQSWQQGGKEIFLTDLRQDDDGYDGMQFAIEYRRTRL